jgi:hypothetical protein
MLVYHLRDGVLQQYHILIEGLDVALQLDAIYKVYRNLYVFLAQRIQKGILQLLTFVTHLIALVGK